MRLLTTKKEGNMTDISKWFIIKVEREGGELYGFYKGYSTQWHPANLGTSPEAKIFRTLKGAEKKAQSIRELIYGDGFEVRIVPFSSVCSKTQKELCGFVN